MQSHTVWVILDCKSLSYMSHRQEESPADYSWTHRKWFYHEHYQQMRLNQHLTDAGMSCGSWHHFICSNANTPTRRELWWYSDEMWSSTYLKNTIMLLWWAVRCFIFLYKTHAVIISTVCVCVCVQREGKFEKYCIKALHYILKTARWAIRFRAGGQRHKPTHRKSLFCLPVCSPHTHTHTAL